MKVLLLKESDNWETERVLGKQQCSPFSSPPRHAKDTQEMKAGLG